MITLISPSTNTKIIEKIVEIHTKCIKETNSQYYNNKQIDEWISLINRENVKDQLKNTTWILLRENNEIIGFAQYSKKDKKILEVAGRTCPVALSLHPDIQQNITFVWPDMDNA